MHISLLTALALLVLTAIGFYIGRQRAYGAGRGRAASLHSLPNYYGYYIALWVGAPAFLLLAVYGVIGAGLVNMLVLKDLERAGAPLVAQYEAQLDQDQLYQDLQEQLVQSTAELEAVEREISYIRRENTVQAERYEDLRARLPEVSSQRISLINQIDAREEEIYLGVFQGAPVEGDGFTARAGFEFSHLPPERRQLYISNMRAYAFDEALASRDTPELRAAGALFRPYHQILRYSVAGLALALALAGLVFSRGKIAKRFRARNHVEKALSLLLFATSVIAVLTTLGIVCSLIFESLRFFGAIDWRLHEFLLGLHWSPQVGIRSDQIGQSGAFGAVPLFAGTALITVIAMAVAVPIGLMSAIYLSEYASPLMRSWAKPILEVLAGIPTVVYGFFALLTVGPFLRDVALMLGYENAATQSALSAGLVMGVMIIPFVSSLSDDVINAVPQTLRDGSYAMGATKSETVRAVVLPAALPGIVGAILLAVSRAVGETMIVVMAAGQGANLTINPLESVTTITVQIVALLTGDQEFDSAKTLSAFALGLVLFMLTLLLNIIALRVVQRYREKYD
ncbi:phosphate ABC transporter permease subunit PstC [Woodsholea maritima]|uniref:phosphate ABC transporter permease subunit PstC n=1 Tax=Woodsholea maritima TaxID=240237 RepID=UPI00036FF312|nr:phosphate ABC transporter permease subunit PstC [Woodsholea maritima]